MFKACRQYLDIYIKEWTRMKFQKEERKGHLSRNFQSLYRISDMPSLQNSITKNIEAKKLCLFLRDLVLVVKYFMLT